MRDQVCQRLLISWVRWNLELPLDMSPRGLLVIIGDKQFWWNSGEKPLWGESVQEEMRRDELEIVIIVSCLEEFYYKIEQRFGAVWEEKTFLIKFSF